jgi:hypothetical protein
VLGGERWLRDHPDRLFLDRSCTQPFPLLFPKAADIRVHRVVVAHGIAEKCKQRRKRPGGLAIDTTVIADSEPFTIGIIAPKGRFIHILDDHSLDIVLGTLDTVADFVSYLESDL